MTSTRHVIIYSKPGCHLCDLAKEAIHKTDCGDLFTLEEINIESDPVLMAKYQYDIPVITINGVMAFKHRVTSTEFRRKIQE